MSATAKPLLTNDKLLNRREFLCYTASPHILPNRNIILVKTMAEAQAIIGECYPVQNQVSNEQNIDS
jgi:hypothetical protein